MYWKCRDLTQQKNITPVLNTLWMIFEKLVPPTGRDKKLLVWPKVTCACPAVKRQLSKCEDSCVCFVFKCLSLIYLKYQLTVFLLWLICHPIFLFELQVENIYYLKHIANIILITFLLKLNWKKKLDLEPSRGRNKVVQLYPLVALIDITSKHNCSSILKALAESYRIQMLIITIWPLSAPSRLFCHNFNLFGKLFTNVSFN